ncbi:MAG: hypothetical protein BRD24_05810 [Halobacteriales archaeon SW_9_67_24]|nr:MAG: hypothetical protein BRD24_05810 [Halobacteriales archaeon SW_9_67_24]
MNANVVAILLIPILLGGMMGASIGSQPGTTTESARPATGEEFGGEITVFMQQHTARANGSIDSGMWLAAFESAESQSRKRALVEQRATTLGVRLDRVEERVGAFSPTKTNRSVRHRAKRARIAADVAALRTAISDAKTAAAREGVNASRLDRLANPDTRRERTARGRFGNCGGVAMISHRAVTRLAAGARRVILLSVRH